MPLRHENNLFNFSYVTTLTEKCADFYHVWIYCIAVWLCSIPDTRLVNFIPRVHSFAPGSSGESCGHKDSSVGLRTSCSCRAASSHCWADQIAFDASRRYGIRVQSGLPNFTWLGFGIELKSLRILAQDLVVAQSGLDP